MSPHSIERPPYATVRVAGYGFDISKFGDGWWVSKVIPGGVTSGGRDIGSAAQGIADLCRVIEEMTGQKVGPS